MHEAMTVGPSGGTAATGITILYVCTDCTMTSGCYWPDGPATPPAPAWSLCGVCGGRQVPRYLRRTTHAGFADIMAALRATPGGVDCRFRFPATMPPARMDEVRWAEGGIAAAAGR